ncbi:MAG: M6 family metalloprotease domain-containing protein, partial [Luteolibacter sp.]
MKKSKTFKLIHLLTALAGCLGYATAAPYGPDGLATQWDQPGGATLKLAVFGDEYYAHTETADGFTVVLDKSNLTYYYAKLSADGSSFVSSGVRADRRAPAGLAKHLEISLKKIREISAANHAKLDGERAARWAKRVGAVQKLRAAAHNGLKLAPAQAAEAQILAAPVTGVIKGLTILAQFPDDKKTSVTDPVNFPTSASKIQRFCNEAGYNDNGNSGSVMDYYSDQSGGLLTYTQSVTKIITLPHPRNYYNYQDYPVNKVIYDDAGTSGRMLINDALAVLQGQNFDFSNLTLGGDKRVLATNVFFAGPDSGDWSHGLWPHQSSLSSNVNVGTVDNPIYIYNYEITNNANSAPVIGTFCHENGHLILDYPDLYSLDGEGVGEHCLMGSGNYLNGGRTPSPINGYLKDLVGWEHVVSLASTDFTMATLPTTGNVCYRLSNPDATTEFFIVENRGEGDKWAQYSDDKGIAIWHVDESVDFGNILGTPHYAVALEQADGLFDLENGRDRGDAQDLYDLVTPLFSAKTNPNSNWWDGSKSGVRVTALSAPGKNVNVRFGAVPPDTIIVGSPNGGEVI